MPPPLPCHLPAGHRVKNRGTGAVGMVWKTSRVSSCKEQPETQHQAQFKCPAPLSCGRIIIKTPQFVPGVTRPSLVPGHSLARAGFPRDIIPRSRASPGSAGLDISGLCRTSLKVQQCCRCSRLAFGTQKGGPLGGSLESWRGPEQLSSGSRRCGNEEKLEFVFGLEGTLKTR